MTQLVPLLSDSGIRVFMIFGLNTFDVQRKLFCCTTSLLYYLFLYTSLIVIKHANRGTR